MRLPVSAVLLPALFVAQAAGWSQTFDYFQCYGGDVNDRMPNTLDNLIALVEKYEAANGYGNIDELSEMLIQRYRVDGIQYNPNGSPHQWYEQDQKEIHKQNLLSDLLRPTKTLPTDSFEPREECGLHFLLSHSTDLYPFPGVNDLWKTDMNKRYKRSPQSSGIQASSSQTYQQQSQSSAFQTSRSGSVMQNTYTTIDGRDPAEHPLEYGVMETAYGPVAAGTLLAGLMSMNKGDVSIASVLDDASYMPSEMSSATLKPVYAAGLAGDAGQLGLVAGLSAGQVPAKVGPKGRYNNCTVCAKIFSLANQQFSYLSRAEVNAGIDVLVMYEAYSNGGSSYIDSMSMSQLLRHYYSEKGLPNNPEYKACNRMKLYGLLDQNELKQQVLNFIYAYQDFFPAIPKEVEINRNDFNAIQNYFGGMMQKAVDALNNFVNSYNYDDENYSKCFFTTMGGGSSAPQNDPPSEGMTDLIAVLAPEGSSDQKQAQRQFIGDVARRIWASTDRSRIGVISGSSGDWMQLFGNISNVADWACNFTTDQVDIGGSSNMDKVLQTLAVFYQQLYEQILTNLDLSSGRSQLVLWQVPGSFSGDTNTFNKSMADFRRRYPDVNIVFVGKNSDPYDFMVQYDDDFISVTSKTYSQILGNSVQRLHEAPRFFVYPACDPNNSTQASNYNENSHVYEGYVYPNYTTYIKIPPTTFHYSEKIEFKVSGNVRACFSRTNRLALDGQYCQNFDPFIDNNINNDVDYCIGGPDDTGDTVTYQRLCDRYVYECNPIYVSITGIGSKGRSSCTSSKSNMCEFVNQIEYELTHKGMNCDATCTLPALLTILLPALLHYFLH